MILLAAQDVSYRVGSASILHGISLTVQEGEFIGLLGPSGCGKSTLLRIMLGMIPPTTGRVTYRNGPQDDQVSFGYVPQDDLVHRALTVEQAFRYACQLRLGPTASSESIAEKVKASLQTLELSKRSGTRIRKLSGGERKRVNLGMELLSDPDVLFLDEPTAGLDPHLDRQMIKLFNNLAIGQRAVLVTTHVLANAAMFETVLFLTAGRLVFAGTHAAALEFFGVRETEEIYSRVRHLPPQTLATRFRESSLYRQYSERSIAIATQNGSTAKKVILTQSTANAPADKAPQTQPLDLTEKSPRPADQSSKRAPDRAPDVDEELARLKTKLKQGKSVNQEGSHDD